MNDKIYFVAGDVVKLKQSISDSPEMVVKSVDKTKFNPGSPGMTSKSGLLGVTCFWFDKNSVHQSQRFNTKDLIHVND
jgi:uncharacterized protein YodC (DUF2158 family)